MKTATILILASLLLICNLGGIALWDPDEPRQALMAREMMERGDYIHPYLNGIPYLEKPPMYPWLIMIAATVTGKMDEFSARIPAALSATLLLLITYWLGSMIANPGAGFLSAIVLLTNYQFLGNARESVMDMTFAMFIGLSIFLGFLSVRKGKRVYFALSFLPAALAVLTKGLAGLAIPACILAVYLLVQREARRYLLPFFAGCLLSAALASIWFILAGESYAREFLVRQNITRYVNAFDHAENYFYYFRKIFFNFLPWSILLPFAIYHGYRRKYWLPLVWFLFVFLFFEFSRSKRAIYLLSLYPAGALLCGLYLRDKWEWLLEKKETRVLTTIFGGILTALPLGSVVVVHSLSSPVVRAFREESLSVYLCVTLLFLAGAAFLYFLARKGPRGALACLVVYFSAMSLFYHTLYMPVMDRGFKSPRLITDYLVGFPKTTHVYTYGFNSAGFIFYVGRPITTISALKEIRDDKRDILLVVEDKQVGHFRDELESHFQPLRKAFYESHHYTIYTRRNGG
jgi:4-amino-4-deoxy-L-arabinose transferase-like glycosyltransferase